MYHSPNYKAKHTSLNGIWNYLVKEGYVKRKGTAFYDPNQEYKKLMKEFLISQGIDVPNKNFDVNKYSKIIQPIFNKFAVWLKENKHELKTNRI